ncbi:MAG: recombinase family protein [Candidatus Rokubacteria bacterium]|nr:recombinase family protein [Candidatus Rokubacteria bacterium]
MTRVARDYRGRIVWGRTGWMDKGGTRRKVDAPEADWVTVEAPHLRILSEELWAAAHARLENTRATYWTRTKGKFFGRPESGIESGYLLTGFLECAECHGGFHATKRTGLRGSPSLYYVCTTHRTRPLVCSNRYGVPLATLHAEVLESFRRDVLTPAVVERTIRRALELYASEDDLRPRREALEAELQRIESDLVRLTEAVTQGGPPRHLARRHQGPRAPAGGDPGAPGAPGGDGAGRGLLGGRRPEPEGSGRALRLAGTPRGGARGGPSGPPKAPRWTPRPHAQGECKRTTLRVFREGVLRQAPGRRAECKGYHSCPN